MWEFLSCDISCVVTKFDLQLSSPILSCNTSVWPCRKFWLISHRHASLASFSIKLRSVSQRLGIVRSGHVHACKNCQPNPLAENCILRVILGFLLSPPPPLIIKVPRGVTAQRTSCNYHVPVNPRLLLPSAKDFPSAPLCRDRKSVV